VAKLGIIADDLSGACDAAAEFAARNFSCIVDIDGTLHDADSVDVVAISTETRNASPDDSRRAIVEIFHRMTSAGVPFVYKKIDSALRGNCRIEMEALLFAGRFKRAFIVPAFPEENRRVVAGFLYVNDEPSSAIHIPSALGDQNLECITVAQCTDQLSLGEGLFVIDAATRDELKRVAQFIWSRLPGSLLAGSAGLAGEIAGLMRNGTDARSTKECQPVPAGGRPVVFVIGSTHPRTRAQINFLKQQRRAEFIEAESGWEIKARETLSSKKDIVLRLDCDVSDFPELSNLGKLIGERLVRAIVASGGYTARLLCKALEAHAIRLDARLIPGTAMGRLIGGAAHHLPLVTKSGGFGEADALAQIRFLLDRKEAA
jgi:uncharacterized protein YgbK (DUF1537 family)